MSAMAVKRAFPQVDVVVVHSSEVPVIGVGESTTALFPPFLHRSLGVDMGEFFRNVRPGWKLGIRFEWGDPSDTHFNYTFDSCMASKAPGLRKTPAFYCMEDWANASRCWALMDRGQPPLIDRGQGTKVDGAFGYHIDNQLVIELLTRRAQLLGIGFVEGLVDAVEKDPESGDVLSLVLTDGRRVSAHIFLDCSGFASRLLGDECGEPFDSYEKWLFCDRAIVGRRPRQPNEKVLPYTTAETMDHGWCWKIEFPDHLTRGYVYSSAFCSDDEAFEELQRKNPGLRGLSPPIEYPRGRYRKFWSHNVVALGNASGFVEPLEATALHLVIEQIRLFCRVLGESDRQSIGPVVRNAANERFRLLWDEVRDFLAVHYRFNRRSDSPFWRHCRENTDLGGAAELVQLYEEAGPTTLCGTTLPGGHVFGYDGFMSMLVGMRAPTRFQNQFSEDDRQRWMEARANI